MTELPRQISSKCQERNNPKLAMGLFSCKLCYQKKKKTKSKKPNPKQNKKTSPQKTQNN